MESRWLCLSCNAPGYKTFLQSLPKELRWKNMENGTYVTYISITYVT